MKNTIGSTHPITVQVLRALGYLSLLSHAALPAAFAIASISDNTESLAFVVACFVCIGVICLAMLAAIVHSRLAHYRSEAERRRDLPALSYAASFSTAFYLIGLPGRQVG
jgi:hypothetical protein